MIVVDTSGSMKGLRMTIAKHTISTILDTLGENDFVNIIAVNVPSYSRIALPRKKKKNLSACTRMTYMYNHLMLRTVEWFSSLKLGLLT